jgi:hypothetical protein
VALQPAGLWILPISESPPSLIVRLSGFPVDNPSELMPTVKQILDCGRKADNAEH